MVMNISCKFQKSSCIFLVRAATVKSLYTLRQRGEVHWMLSGGYNEKGDKLCKWSSPLDQEQGIKGQILPFHTIPSLKLPIS